MLWLHHSASVLLCDVSTRTLGAVYDDDVSLTSCLQLLQQTGVDIGNVACSKCLQYHSLHRGLEERAHLGEGEGEFSYMSHSQGLSTEEGEPKSAAIFPFTLTPSHPHSGSSHPRKYPQNAHVLVHLCVYIKLLDSLRAMDSIPIHWRKGRARKGRVRKGRGRKGRGRKGRGRKGRGKKGRGRKGRARKERGRKGRPRKGRARKGRRGKKGRGGQC